MQDAKNNKQVYILCGLSGSGKTAWAENKKAANAEIGIKTTRLSTNDWFRRPNGEWKFDIDMLQKHHRAMHEDFIASLEANDPVVIVDNTNIMEWHRRPFAAGAHRYDYAVHYVIFGDFTKEFTAFCTARTLHGVDLAYQQAQAERFETPGDARAWPNFMPKRRFPAETSVVMRQDLGWNPNWRQNTL